LTHTVHCLPTLTLVVRFYFYAQLLLLGVKKQRVFNQKTRNVFSDCKSILLYGLQVCPLNRADMHSLDFCVNRLLMKLSHTSNVSVVEECRHYFNFTLPSELLCQRTEKFLRKLIAHV